MARRALDEESGWGPVPRPRRCIVCGKKHAYRDSYRAMYRGRTNWVGVECEKRFLEMLQARNASLKNGNSGPD